MNTSMKYYEDSWQIGESFFNKYWLGKYETIFSQGNGYMGIRAATEEKYVGEKRNTFVAGTFNTFDDQEVTELPNVPDSIQMRIVINGHALDLSTGKVRDYERVLNLKTGELIRSFVWTTPDQQEVAFTFKRFVSKERLHVFGQQVMITPLTGDVQVELTSGIDGRQTNSGSQHFHEGEKRLHGGRYLQMVSETTHSAIHFVLSTAHTFRTEDSLVEPKTRVEMPRRQLVNLYWLDLTKGETLTVEKLSNIHTTRDKEHEGKQLEVMAEEALKELEATLEEGYSRLAKESAAAWERNVWQVAPIQITSTDSRDQLALHFAKYHLHVMTPAHDNRMNVGAKGLSGEGYKGHTFWDTEIFILPYFIYTHPEMAKSLVEYRFLGLEGARRKARENGFAGAQYPWEAAWIADGETTPVWGAADIVTGKATKIWSGFIEQHITADVAFGVQQYTTITKDPHFMEAMGYEIILDTAKFWTSRVEYDERSDRYVITDVIGPDEYKEHADNNAFTNYMAHWNMSRALEIIQQLREEEPEIYQRLDKRLDLQALRPELEAKLAKLYLPQPNEEGVIPQDDDYLSKAIIDLTKYKTQGFVGGLFHDYNLEQVNDMQITKQADVLLLLYLLESEFPHEVKVANWHYYEPKTMHDSSLSLSTHAVLAADLGDPDLSYAMFRRATEIDMGPAMNSSNEGIHAASLGGIWQMVVFGYGGVRAWDGQLRIDPNLPKAWERLTYTIFWQQNELEITVDKQQLTVVNKTGQEAVPFETYGKTYAVKDRITIPIEQYTTKIGGRV